MLKGVAFCLRPDKRRGRGEDSIYWDEAKDRYVGAVSLGYSRSGTRIRKKVMGRTKTEVREAAGFAQAGRGRAAAAAALHGE